MSDKICVSKSRIAKMSVAIPSSLKFSIDKSFASISGSNGLLSIKIPKGLNVSFNDGQVSVCELSDDYIHFAGTIRAVLSNFVVGLTSGFTKRVKLSGVGFKASIVEKEITMNLGYSHPVKYVLPESVTASLISPTEIELKSYDKVLLGDVVANLVRLRKPDSYKGKGVVDLSKGPLRIKEGKKK